MLDPAADKQALATLARKADLSDLQLHFGDEKIFDFFVRQTHSISVLGSFRQIGEFFAAVGPMERIANLRNFRLTPRNGALSLEAEVATFRMLGDGDGR